MSLQCPYCRAPLTLKEARQGRYTPKCAKCGQQFLLVVPAEGVPHATTAPLPSKPAVQVEETLPTSMLPAARAAGAGHEATVASLPQDATLAEPAAAPAAGDIPAVLGGYRIIRELGRGAMGVVYLAKQTSLDRDVALKVVQAQWAENPTLVARFIREAYAAAQLTHHNIVQVYDLASEGGKQFFSMEFVKGQSLSDLLAREGRLAPDVAVGYILQAARGLKFAHDHGMVHRDIKPANLLLSQQGIVKVADLGLVKTPGLEDEPLEGGNVGQAEDSSISRMARTDVTQHNIAMGTPAYMAPEQATDAAHVDHRADIYSLGCTLYVLLTGKPPFEGATAQEVISRHKSEPIVRPDAVVKRIPKELADITVKMVAKRPEDRYATLDDVIRDLERFLGVPTQGQFSPNEEHLQILEEGVRNFNAAPLARLRPLCALAYAALSLLMLLVGAFWTRHLFAAGIGMLLVCPVAYFVISGWSTRSALFERARAYVLGARITDWLTTAIGLVVLLLMAFFLGLLWGMAAGALLGAGAALAMHLLVDRRLAAQRAGALQSVQEMLKGLRLKGLEESSLQSFAARFSGDVWEEFFEALFGYEAKLRARELYGRGDGGRLRSTFRSWRDPVFRWLEHRLRLRREAKERNLFREVETRRLCAEGVPAAEAKLRAAQAANTLVAQAGELRESAQAAPGTLKSESPEQKRARVKAMLAAAKRGEGDPRPGSRFESLGFLLAPLGAKVRFLVGALLIAGCVLWAHQNKFFAAVPKSVEELKQAAKSTAETASRQVESGVGAQASASSAADVKDAAAAVAATKPLALPLVPALLTNWIDTFNVGIAGLILVLSALSAGARISLAAYPAAAVAALGQRVGLPDFPVLHVWVVSAGAGIALFLIGGFLLRGRN